MLCRNDAISIDELIHRREEGSSLEQDFYVSPQVFERDMERIYFRHWLFAGHVSRIPDAGNYFTYSVGSESIILVRDAEGHIHGLYNVCRHRGSRICTQEQGTLKKLVCPYHAWTYDLNGRLLAARHLPNDFNKSDYGLHRCHVRVVQGLVFISLVDDPPPFNHIAADIDRYFAPHGWPDAKICRRTRHVIRANWKLVAENFWECYHCGPTHPELASVMSYVHALDSKRCAAERAAYTEAWQDRARQMGRLTEHSYHSDGLYCQSVRIPIREGFVTQSRNGKPVAPLMGDYSEYDGGVTSVQFFPINWLTACNDYAMLARFTPLTVRETECELCWLVRSDANEGVDYDVEEVTWMWRRTIEEDVGITENNQLGVNSRRYRPGPYNEAENLVDKLIRWYLTEIV